MRSQEQSLAPSGAPTLLGAVPVTHLPPRGAVPVTHSLIITLERGASLPFYVSGASTMTQVSFTWTKEMVPYCFVTIHQGRRARGRAGLCMTNHGDSTEQYKAYNIIVLTTNHTNPFYDTNIATLNNIFSIHDQDGARTQLASGACFVGMLGGTPEPDATTPIALCGRYVSEQICKTAYKPRLLTLKGSGPVKHDRNGSGRPDTAQSLRLRGGGSRYIPPGEKAERELIENNTNEVVVTHGRTGATPTALVSNDISPGGSVRSLSEREKQGRFSPKMLHDYGRDSPTQLLSVVEGAAGE